MENLVNFDFEEFEGMFEKLINSLLMFECQNSILVRHLIETYARCGGGRLIRGPISESLLNGLQSAKLFVQGYLEGYDHSKLLRFRNDIDALDLEFPYDESPSSMDEQMASIRVIYNFDVNIHFQPAVVNIRMM